MAAPTPPYPTYPLHTALSVTRGVYVAPWMGPSGELILVAIRRDGRLVGERRLVLGDDHLGASDALWAALEGVDPEPALRVI